MAGLGWKKVKEREIEVGPAAALRKTFELPDGKVRDFFTVKRRPSVCVLALTPDRRAILVKQFRLGPGRIRMEKTG